MRRFFDYGMPLEGAAATEVAIDLPGGLSIEGAEGTITIASTTIDARKQPELDVLLIDPTGCPIAVAALAGCQFSKGLSGEKGAIRAAAWNGIIDFDIRFDTGTGSTTVTVELHSISDHRPADAVEALDFLSALSPPNSLAIRVRHGPAIMQSKPIPHAIAPGMGAALEVCRALAIIQEHTFQTVWVPEMSRISPSELSEWDMAARLLHGEDVPVTWSYVGLKGATAESGNPYHAEEGETISAVVPLPLEVTVLGQKIPLGWTTLQVSQARVSQVGDDGTLHLTPTGDESGVLRWVAESNPAEQDTWPGRSQLNEPLNAT